MIYAKEPNGIEWLYMFTAMFGFIRYSYMLYTDHYELLLDLIETPPINFPTLSGYNLRIQH